MLIMQTLQYLAYKIIRYKTYDGSGGFWEEHCRRKENCNCFLDADMN